MLVDIGDSEDKTPPAEETGPLRTCIATGEVKGKKGMIRFVLSPDGKIVADLAEKLPGRGVWLTASSEALAAAIKGKRFARAFRRQVTPDEGMAERLAAGLRHRCLDWLALANKGGLAVVGFAKVEPMVAAGKAALLLQANDAGSDGLKLLQMQQRRGGRTCLLFERAELGAPFGRDELVHIGLKSGGTTERFLRELRRMAGFNGNDGLYDAPNHETEAKRTHD